MYASAEISGATAPYQITADKDGKEISVIRRKVVEIDASEKRITKNL
jgi:hypothetical protein